ncbi:hypothetical protein NBRC116188_15070 [Oceaniserpentilla sp. 4NH20-0058]|uniref:CYTH domain-containing protein n=1 Tax=Oceaniserpentilla sp. 4NH20-0058 TaxID=3127660 RepID=UPI00310B08D6
MANEVELKLTLPSQAVASFKLDADLGSAQGAPLLLDNQYFDTPSLDLNKSHAALRVRKSQHGYKQTLKNKGHTIAGLHQRGEWEYDIPSDQIDWLLFENDIQLQDKLKQNIRPIFKTDFTRHVWLKTYGESEIELVLDEGSIQSNNPTPEQQANNSQSINLCEIELELKSGNIEDLFCCALELASRHPLVPCDINKAERGYGLLSPEINFFTPQDFAKTWQQKQLPVFQFLQEVLTRMSRHWDRFSQQENWWSLQAVTRQVHTICWLLSEIPNCPDSLRGRWLVLQQDLLKLLQPAVVVSGLYVDINSNSRGLSQRLLNLNAPQLSKGLATCMKNNGLGLAMLDLGHYLFQQDQNDQAQPNVFDSVKKLMHQATQEQYVCETSLHTLAYICLRCGDSRYSFVNDVIRCQTVVNGMISAKDMLNVMTDDISRAKLASWQRRLTVENRNLLDAKQALTEQGWV